MSTATAELREQFFERHRATDEEYRKLVIDYDAGVEVDSVKVIDLLNRAGRTVDDLEADSVAYGERRAKIANVASAPELQKQRDELHAVIDRDWAAEQKRREQYAAAILPKISQRDALDMQLEEIANDRRWLLANPTQATITAKAANERQRKSVGRQLADADEALRTWRAGHNRVVRNRESAEGDVLRVPSEHHKRQLEQFKTVEANSEAHGEQLQARYDDLQQRVTALGEELDAINRAEWSA